MRSRSSAGVATWGASGDGSAFGIDAELATSPGQGPLGGRSSHPRGAGMNPGAPAAQARGAIVPSQIPGKEPRMIAAPLSSLSDNDLVARFRAGDEAAFTEIHRRFRAALVAFARRMLASSGHDADDVVQDT